MMKTIKVKINPNYEELFNILMEAFNRAANGKGRERHGIYDCPFKDQKIFKIEAGLYDNKSYGLMFQAIKKLQEGQFLDVDKRINERLDAIVYIAASVIRAKNGEESA